MPTLNLGRVGFVNKGTWLISNEYKINDTVTYLGGTYAALQANTGQTPILGGTVYWEEWVANDVVHKSGAETIAGVKTFTSSPIVPDATTAFQPLTFGQFSAKLASDINAATAKTTPVNADLFGIVDSAASNVLKKLSWANIKATLKTYFDTLYTPIGSGIAIGVRQTVQSGSVDTSGFANFVSTSVTLDLPIDGTIPVVIHAAGGAISADRLGTISADKTLLLPASSTSYIYESVATDGVCTSGSTTLAPIYQFGGTPAVTNGQFTFNIGEMKGYLGNGTTAPQVWMVFTGEAVTSGSAVTSVVTYALNGMYDSGYTATLPSAAAAVSKNHNIGTDELKCSIVAKCTTIDVGFAAGDIFEDISCYGSSFPMKLPITRSRNIMKFKTGDGGGWYLINQTSGALAAATLASWSYKLIAKRGW